jgi:hypothetical protein
MSPNPANALREIVIARSSFTRPCVSAGRDDGRFALGVAPGIDIRLGIPAATPPPIAGVGIRLRRTAASGKVLSVTNAGSEGRFSTFGIATDTRIGAGAEVRIGDGVANGADFMSAAVIPGIAIGDGVTLSDASTGLGVIPGAPIGDAVSLSAPTSGLGVAPAVAIGGGVSPADATAGFGVTLTVTAGFGVVPVAAIGFGATGGDTTGFGVTFSAVGTGGGVTRSASAISFSVSLFSIFAGAGAGTRAGCMLKELRPKYTAPRLSSATSIPPM